VTGKQTGDMSKLFGHSPTANIDGVKFNGFKAVTDDDKTEIPVEIGPQQVGGCVCVCGCGTCKRRTLFSALPHPPVASTLTAHTMPA
jgi:hypothetical protein